MRAEVLLGNSVAVTAADKGVWAGKVVAAVAVSPTMRVAGTVAALSGTAVQPLINNPPRQHMMSNRCSNFILTSSGS
ncbi:MAG: hypothetical protein HS099_30105 [Ardenticatenaceae bacterium]|nr:hypothetical protein [Ardenticatenaceae bacterium]